MQWKCCRVVVQYVVFLLSLILIFFIGFSEWVIRSSILLILHSTQSTRLSLNRLAATKPKIRNDGKSVWVQFRVTVSCLDTFLSLHDLIYFLLTPKWRTKRKIKSTNDESSHVYTVVWDERRTKRNGNTRTQHAVISLFICIIYKILCDPRHYTGQKIII